MINLRYKEIADTQPVRSDRGMESFQPIHIYDHQNFPTRNPIPVHSKNLRWLFGGFLTLILAYFFLPLRTNILVLGVDGGLGRGDLGRTDTIMLTTISPLRPYIGLLSVPRDLWVEIPNNGPNRINTAYFFAEANTPGSGVYATKDVIWQNFGVRANYSVVLKMDGLIGLIGALGGLDVTLPAAMSGYNAGTYHFDGEDALAFVRSRAGSDDFARMRQGQVLAKAAILKLLKPITWLNYSEIFDSLSKFVEFDIPYWQWPRLGLALFRTGLSGLDARVITREMVTPFMTSGGAQVLGPNWTTIEPLLKEMFGK